LYQLKKADTPMSKHIDVYSGNIAEIQFHLPHGKRWNDESINRRFVRTLPMTEWLPWVRATGTRIATMTPAQLYAEILIDDEVLHGVAPAKEASLAARIGGGGGNSGGSGKRNKRRGGGGGNKGRNNRFQPYDGYTYKGPPPDSASVKSMKEKWGSDYRECRFCTWPGHTVNDCRKLKEVKSKGSPKRTQTTGQKSSGNSNRENTTSSSSSGKFIGWEASVTELGASATTAMNGEHVWGLDSHANVHLTPYRHRFVTYRQFDKPEQVTGWQGTVDTAFGVGSIDLVSQNGKYRLHNVYYAPIARKQLLSAGKPPSFMTI
jgi:hypothetical protein